MFLRRKPIVSKHHRFCVPCRTCYMARLMFSFCAFFHFVIPLTNLQLWKAFLCGSTHLIVSSKFFSSSLSHRSRSLRCALFVFLISEYCSVDLRKITQLTVALNWRKRPHACKYQAKSWMRQFENSICFNSVSGETIKRIECGFENLTIAIALRWFLRI